MSNFWKIAAPIVFIFALSAVGKAQAEERTGILPTVPAPTSTDRALTVISTSAAADDDILDCVENSLLSEIPYLIMVSHSEFRNSLFPWFEPKTAPESEAKLADLLSKRLVSEKISVLGVRYIVAVGGGTQTTSESWGGIAGSPQAAVFAGGVSIDSKTDLVAQVLDLKTARKVTEKKASVEDEGGVGIIILIPYIAIPQTETAACDALAKQIAGIFE